MSITPEALKKIADLAYIKIEDTAKLEKEINAILDFVEALKTVDTSNIAPLSHPLEIYQPLREDEVTEPDCEAKLEAIAPHFKDKYYWVPAVLETDD